MASVDGNVVWTVMRVPWPARASMLTRVVMVGTSGPPTHPLTVVEHDLSPGGKVSYFVTSPEGDRISGWWRILAVDAPRRLEFELGGPEVPTMTGSSR